MNSLEIAKRYVEWMINVGNDWHRRNSSKPWILTVLSGLGEYRVDRSRSVLQIQRMPNVEAYFDRDSIRPASQYFLLKPPVRHSHRTVYLFRPRVHWENDELHKWTEGCDALLRMCTYKEVDEGGAIVFHYGQRFEGPEPPGSGNATAHVQMLNDGAGNLWIDESIPAAPIRADEPHEVILCALSGVYGAIELHRLAVTTGSSILKGRPMTSLRSYLERIGLDS
jgi:hypothetical protein